MSLLVLLMSLAWADSRLVIETDRAVVVVVNRVPHTLSAGQSAEVKIPSGKEGGQYVTVTSLIGEVRWEGKIPVPRDTEVRCSWQGREFVVVGQRSLGSSVRMPPGAGRAGGRFAPPPAPSGDLPLHDAYLLVVKEALDWERRTGQITPPAGG